MLAALHSFAKSLSEVLHFPNVKQKRACTACPLIAEEMPVHALFASLFQRYRDILRIAVLYLAVLALLFE